jgi:hypothetical protein
MTCRLVNGMLSSGAGLHVDRLPLGCEHPLQSDRLRVSSSFAGSNWRLAQPRAGLPKISGILAPEPAKAQCPSHELQQEMRDALKRTHAPPERHRRV